jgi:hypothetical protein
MLAYGQGSLLNAARLAQALAVTSPMVGRYIDLLEDLLLVRRLQPWSGNLAKRLVRSPKVYVRDAGLVHGLLEIEQGFFIGSRDIQAARRIVVYPGSESYPARDGVDVLPLKDAILAVSSAEQI